jgi:hypothetical protein
VAQLAGPDGAENGTGDADSAMDPGCTPAESPERIQQPCSAHGRLKKRSNHLHETRRQTWFVAPRWFWKEIRSTTVGPLRSLAAGPSPHPCSWPPSHRCRVADRLRAQPIAHPPRAAARAVPAPSGFKGECAACFGRGLAHQLHGISRGLRLGKERHPDVQFVRRQPAHLEQREPCAPHHRPSLSRGARLMATSPRCAAPSTVAGSRG